MLLSLLAGFELPDPASEQDQFVHYELYIAWALISARDRDYMRRATFQSMKACFLFGNEQACRYLDERWDISPLLARHRFQR